MGSLSGHPRRGTWNQFRFHTCLGSIQDDVAFFSTLAPKIRTQIKERYTQRRQNWAVATPLPAFPQSAFLGTGEIPAHWLEARLSLVYKKGSTTSAMNYRPINASNCIYIVLAQLILDAIQQPINTTLSDVQAVSRKGYTTSQQAMNLLMELHERPEGSYICLLDIAKAFPSTPHVSCRIATGNRGAITCESHDQIHIHPRYVLVRKTTMSPN